MYRTPYGTRLSELPRIAGTIFRRLFGALLSVTPSNGRSRATGHDSDQQPGEDGESREESGGPLRESNSAAGGCVFGHGGANHEGGLRTGAESADTVRAGVA